MKEIKKLRLELIEEHKELTRRIYKLHQYIYGPDSDNEEKVEFANKCIQLAAMKKYEEALGARLFNVGVEVIDGKYMQEVEEPEARLPYEGNDFDVDKGKHE